LRREKFVEGFEMKMIPVVGVRWLLAWAVVSSSIFSVEASPKAEGPRQVLSLDGEWQIAEGGREVVPERFGHVAPVPGLVDMARPAFAEVGERSGLREAFWYRREFLIDGEVPEVALLKIHKARYGSKVILNGQELGEHLPSFTASYFEVKGSLKGQGATNELLIRVGADRETLPRGMPTGWDFEKYRYLPGIYDSVEVILTAKPYIVNVQTVPDITTGSVRVVAEIEAGLRGGAFKVQGEVRESRSGRGVGQGSSTIRLAAGERRAVDFTIPIARARLWSPEEPFLYELTVSTGADACQTRFGLRSFSFEPGGKYALLNGKRYFLRGSNVTIYRFFEDGERGDKPWREEWVRRLHEKVKSMHWNALRYCIGFPPDFWYDIADEVGILIQDEFPIWTLSEDPEKLESARIVPEYTAWMRERWNHPSVVIWDAQNESSIGATGEALRAVRHLDLSRRPWENGWAEPQDPGDCVEAHPYLMIGLYNPAWGGRDFTGMKDMVRVSGVPPLNAAQGKLKVPIIINEYAWLWLTREGQPTCLTGPVYDKLLGPNATIEQRRQFFARTLAAKTEFWRTHRECAGVLHFCVLGYSRPGDKPRPEGGATSDHWVDVERLELEPHFEREMRDAFSPVGIMLDFWADEVEPGAETRSVQVRVINDLEREWRGRVVVRVVKGDRTVARQVQRCRLEGLGREILTFAPEWPRTTGEYTLVAELDGRGPTVRSLRDFRVR
jgi:beta-galactosidase